MISSLPAFIGRGFGGSVLAAGVEQAWQWPGARRVWVHTCNFDHPNALANYRARGFSVDRIERVLHDVFGAGVIRRQPRRSRNDGRAVPRREVRDFIVLRRYEHVGHRC